MLVDEIALKEGKLLVRAIVKFDAVGQFWIDREHAISLPREVE